MMVNQTAALVKFIADSLLRFDPLRTDSLLTCYRKQSRIRPVTASRLSLLLPGLGQLYIKDGKNAANAFLLNAGIATAMIITSQYHPIVDAALFWGFPLMHYYVGNSKAAGELAEEKREKVALYYYKAFSDYLSGNR